MDIDLTVARKVFSVARELRAFRHQQLARGRITVPDSEMHAYLDEFHADLPLDVRRVIARAEIDRISDAEHAGVQHRRRRAVKSDTREV